MNNAVSKTDDAVARIEQAVETPGSVSVRTGVDVQSIQALRTMDSEVLAAVKNRSFTEAERAYCERTGSPPQHYAARWAAKEAFQKCIAGAVPLSAVSVSRSNGRPELDLTPQAQRALTETLQTNCWTLELSLSHDRAADAAIAQLLVVGDRDA